MFNSEARWDRPLPGEEALPGAEIAAAVSFYQGKIKPLWFDLRQERHIIKTIFFFWKEKKGNNSYYLFSVSDRNDCRYQLCFNRANLSWRLLTEEDNVV